MVVLRKVPWVHQHCFAIVLAVAVIVGLGLRLWHYDEIPGFNETADEFMYAWAGMTWLQTGTPSSWSGVPAYGKFDRREYWGEIYTFVTPWVHKPPLYPLLSGGWALLAGTAAVDEVRLTTIRVVPIMFGTLSILLIGVLGKKLFDPTIGMVAALLYATVPTVVIANRLAVIESVLTPVLLVAAIALAHYRSRQWRWVAVLAGVSAVAVLLKQTGSAVAIAIVAELARRRQWRDAGVVAAVTGAAVAVYLAGAAAYIGPERLLPVMLSFAEGQSNGEPQFLSSLFRYPVVSNRRSFLVDPFMLLGYVALLAAPWLTYRAQNLVLFLSLPVTYLALLVALESGNRYWFGWHVYPLWPFALLAAAVVLVRTFREQTWPQIATLALFFTLSVGHVVKIFPAYVDRWQVGVATLFAVGAVVYWLLPARRKIALLAVFAVLLAINIAVVGHQAKFLPALPQPPNAAVAD